VQEKWRSLSFQSSSVSFCFSRPTCINFCQERKWTYLVLEKGNRWWCWPPLLFVFSVSPFGFSSFSLLFRSPSSALLRFLTLFSCISLCAISFLSSSLLSPLPLSIFFSFSLLHPRSLSMFLSFLSLLPLPVLCVSLFFSPHYHLSSLVSFLSLPFSAVHPLAAFIARGCRRFPFVVAGTE